MIILILALSYGVSAQEVGDRVNRFELRQSERSSIMSKIRGENKRSPSANKPNNRKKGPKKVFKKGNLGADLRRKKPKRAISTKQALVINAIPVNPTALEIGDQFECLISQDIIGYVGSLSPVSAEVLSGPYKGSKFIGNATMDSQTKKVIVAFNKLVLSSQKSVLTLAASLQDTDGALGVKGAHSSRYWSYFFTAVLSRAAQGYASSQVDQSRNFFGDFVPQPTTKNAAKVAAAEAAAQTAQILEDEVRNRPEYTTVKGPLLTRVFITKTPTLRRSIK